MAGVLVFYFGRNDSMMALVGQQLKAAGLDAIGFRDEKVLEDELAKGEARLLVIGAGVEEAPRARLKAYCAARGILVHENSGGPGAMMEHVAKLLG